MSRLPQPGGDCGAWGDILNQYLRREHNNDGTHDLKVILNAPITAGLVMVSDPAALSGVAWRPASTVQGSPARNIELQTSHTHVQWRFVGDLAWSDLVALTEITGPPGPDGQQGQPGQGIAVGGAAGQVLRKQTGANYDTTWSGLNKNDVGLSNIDNTSDLAKPVSTATQMAINQSEANALALAVAL